MENIIKEVIGILEGTEIASELEAISCFFASVQPDFDHFMQKFGISCPSGCGSCCEHFIPDLTRSEALIIASFIIQSERKDELMDMPDGDIHPFFHIRRAFFCAFQRVIQKIYIRERYVDYL